MPDDKSLSELIEDRSRTCLEHDAEDEPWYAAVGIWEKGARLAELGARVRKLEAETPPGSDTVDAATSRAFALIEAALAGDFHEAEPEAAHGHSAREQ